ncbi:cell division protein FtsA [Thiohalorhabdus denitrificans]|uniref:Cell division protein FtsA n=1 Tax=Thiohalorhabdus denitrificans TaxID=381306 RepID=A0A0P9ELP0_9GAMM|nr:cell division protein FtsA [Thiohalorhabdus denitrificans]KPV39496.1 cell division protein FtsA [Thiohalorhabdus denitrificans]SCY00733.1 cell division protein FtsA [Thiohalorhabdus denitrificans]
MTRNTDNNLIVGLDIGTSKVCAVVGTRTADGGLEIIGIGRHPSRGLRKGVVVNIESTVASIRAAVEEAELMAGCTIESVWAGIAGSHIRGHNSQGVVAIKNQEVDEADVQRVMENGRAFALPTDQKILHVLPQEFIIDNQEGVREPIGMSGVRLEAKIHVITGAVSAVQNIIKCVRRCDLEVNDVVLEQVASSAAVLSDDERELGVCMVDIGGGTSDIAVYTQGSLRHTAVLPVGGDQITSDIAFALRTPTWAAEEIKQSYGCALTDLIQEDEEIDVPSVGGREPRKLARQTLTEIIQPRVEELFNLVQEELRRSGLEEVVASGIVLTGGSSQMEGMQELAEEIFHAPVRMGFPEGVGGLNDVVRNPMYATGVGLVEFGREHGRDPSIRDWSGSGWKTIVKRMRAWFRENF